MIPEPPFITLKKVRLMDDSLLKVVVFIMVGTVAMFLLLNFFYKIFAEGASNIAEGTSNFADHTSNFAENTSNFS